MDKTDECTFAETKTQTQNSHDLLFNDMYVNK